VQTPTSNGPSASMADGDALSQAKSTTAELGQKAADAIDGNRGAAARGIDSAASSLHAKADSLPGGQKVTGAAHKAADAMETAAGYVREHDLKSAYADVRKIVKDNPGPALLTAAALGFLLARTFSRN
jgi:ElaB/YqjD/DUF883 family membrane-anchored ribosome-binding protein